jgi:uncharacterized delta-60 repeat protein
VIDVTFANGGVLTPMGAQVQARAISSYPDGKLAFAGLCATASTNQLDFCVERFHSNGLFDGSFGIAGESVVDIAGGNDYARNMLIQPDGALVLTGSCVSGGSNYQCTVRLKNDGTLDTTFGAGGILLASDVSSDAMLLQPDGKLLTTQYTSGLRRRHGDGSPDTSFGSNGQVPQAFTSTDGSTRLSMQSDGKIVLATSCTEAGVTSFCVARYEGGPFGYKNCALDIDGDNRVMATTDSLIHARIALGITGPAVIGGITFAPNATRNTWPLIRDYLVTQCGMSLVQ